MSRALYAGGVLAMAALLAASGCGKNVTPPASVGNFTTPPSIPNAPLGTNAIAHVVVIVQENRSFDNLFHGFPGADTVSSGKASFGNVQLTPVSLATLFDIEHLHQTFESEYDDGRMDGFNRAGIVEPPHQNPPNGDQFPYAFVPASQVVPYWTLAKNYALADRTFESNSGPSFAAHQYLIAAQSDNIPDGPSDVSIWGCDSAPGTTELQISSSGQYVQGPFPCFTYTTLATELDDAHVSWRYYTPGIHDAGGIFNAYDAIHAVRYGPDWTSDVISPETRVLRDVAAGQLASVTWVVPNAANSDHSGSRSLSGPKWVSSVVNAIGESPFWSSTAIFILWDDWGGWYDHVTPPQYGPMGPGFRIPLLVVSPYAKHGYISHVTHEAASTTKFIEDAFGLPSMHQADARVDDLRDCFDFTQRPAPYVPLSVDMRPQDFEHEPDTAPDSS
jgi:phospholipase C